VRARRMFFDALRGHSEGKLPFGLDSEIDYARIRALAITFPRGTNWLEIDPLNPRVAQAAS
jgi:hypothetical protein